MAAKTALVLGGSAGIGLATARALADTGRRVLVTGRSQERMDAAIAGDARLVGTTTDMSNLAEIAELANRLSAENVVLDVLVANAGAAEKTLFGTTSEAEFDAIFDLNVKGVFFAVQSMLPLLADQASIILIGSISSIKGVPDRSVYNASKAALRSFARSWANDLRNRRIRVNTVSPGFTRTPLLQSAQPDGSWDSLAAFVAESSPAGRIGEPEEIANVVRFLASDEASLVNGVELFVDGGYAQV